MILIAGMISRQYLLDIYTSHRTLLIASEKYSKNSHCEGKWTYKNQRNAWLWDSDDNDTLLAMFLHIW